jgi:hypothetical protein
MVLGGRGSRVVNGKPPVPISVSEQRWFSAGADSRGLLLMQIEGLVKYWRKRQRECRDKPRQLLKAKEMEHRCRKLLRDMEHETGDEAPP